MRRRLTIAAMAFGLALIASGCLLNWDFAIPPLEFDIDLPEVNLLGEGQEAGVTLDDGFLAETVDLSQHEEVAENLDKLKMLNSATVTASVSNPLGQPATVSVYFADQAGLTADTVAGIATELLSFDIGGNASGETVTQNLDRETLDRLQALFDPDDPEFHIYLVADTGDGQPVPVTIEDLKLDLNAGLGLSSAESRSPSEAGPRRFVIEII